MKDYFEEKQEDVISLIGRIALRVIVASLLVLAVFVTAKVSFQFGQSIFYQKPVEEAPGRDIEFEVLEGDTASEVAARMKEAGAVSSELPFSIQLRLYGTEFVPGTYIVNTSMTPRQILEVLGEGPQEEGTHGSD